MTITYIAIDLQEESHQERSRWEETLRTKIKQQIGPKEQSYYDVIRQLQLEIKVGSFHILYFR